MGLTAHTSLSSKSLEQAWSQNRSINSRKYYGKRRASIACSSCRKRKIRCDAISKGYPCTNCSARDTFCAFQKRKNCKSKKKAWLQGSYETEVDIPDQPPRFFVAERNSGNGIDCMLGFDPLLNLSEVDKKLLEYAIHGSQLEDKRSQRNANLPDPSFLYCDDLRVQIATDHALAIKAGVNKPRMSLSQLLSGPTQSVPSFLKGPSHQLTQDDFDYLGKKGALTLPETVLRDELIRSYIEYVHGYMPILDLHGFLRTLYRGDSETEKLSLLLFQCVMFAGTAYVDLHYLIAGGFATRKIARKALFEKAKLLYDFDYENDHISIVQSLLPMTFWCETPDDQKDLWYWMGLASSTSLGLGLHNDATKWKLDTKTGHLLKRISWSCFMRDQVVALGIQRPTHISFKGHNMPMLTVEDFDIEDISASNINCATWDSKYLQGLAIMCIEKAKACLFVSRILSTLYYASHQSKLHLVPAGSISPMNTLQPKTDNMMAGDVEVCDKQLQEWYSNRPEEVKYKPSGMKVSSTGEDSVMVHQAILDMLYFTAISALHRPQLLRSGEPPANEERSRYAVQQAARHITAIAADLSRLDLVRYLPGCSSTVILPAIMTHLVGIRSGHSKAKQESFEGFCTCMAVMQRLRYIYNSADVITALLQFAISKVAGDESGNIGNIQSGPGPAELLHFMNESSPKNQLPIGLAQDRQSGQENLEEYSQLFSSEILDEIKEIYNHTMGSQTSTNSTGKSINSPGVDIVSFPSPDVPSSGMINGQALQFLTDSNSLSQLYAMRQTDSAPGDKTFMDTFGETNMDFPWDIESAYDESLIPL